MKFFAMKDKTEKTNCYFEKQFVILRRQSPSTCLLK